MDGRSGNKHVDDINKPVTDIDPVRGVRFKH